MVNSIIKDARRRGVHKLRQRDFKEGTFRIKKSGYYELAEDIVFNPRENYKFLPDPENPLYQDRAYSLGFFAAITVEADNVVINLAGHTLSASNLFSLCQRFFALIELADRPFIPTQGPGNFGEAIKSANGVVIKDGTLGRSSHHSIHGNANTNICVENVKMVDFEVAGLAINGVDNLYVHKVTIGPNFKQVPVLGNFSAALFLPQFYDSAEKQSGKKIDRYYLEKLQGRVDRLINKYRQTGEVTDSLFKNVGGLADGNNYGLLVHVPGVAVNDYVEEDFGGKLNKNIHLKSVTIDNIAINVNEIVGISDQHGNGALTDPSGSVFHITENNKGNSIKDDLKDAQIYLANFCNKHKIMIGKQNITQAVIDWYYGNHSLNDLLKSGYKLKCNGDSMFHVNKGCHGIRLDACEAVKITDVHIKRLTNVGKMGDEHSCGNYLIGHDKQERPGYGGCATNGLHLSFCKDVKITPLTIEDLESQNGDCRGIRMINQTVNILMDNITIDYLRSGYKYADGVWYGKASNGEYSEYTASYPNKVPNAIGIQLDENCELEIRARIIKNLDAPGCEVPIWTH